ncbi:PREDICTED: uncharacterized protein LOC106124075 [Papilio xuthus]|nr:PREDICTED: uncharacterized protein LOC106124075 [Papilio xuthus]
MSNILPLFLDLEAPRRPNQRHVSLQVRPEEVLEELSRLQEYDRPRNQQPTILKKASSAIKKAKNKFQVNLDVQCFAPEELSVVTINGFVVVEGKHEEKRETHCWVSREFRARYPLPEGCGTEAVRSQLSSDGVLTVTAPLQKQARAVRLVPVVYIGPVRSQHKSAQVQLEEAFGGHVEGVSETPAAFGGHVEADSETSAAFNGHVKTDNETPDAFSEHVAWDSETSAAFDEHVAWDSKTPAAFRGYAEWDREALAALDAHVEWDSETPAAFGERFEGDSETPAAFGERFEGDSKTPAILGGRDDSDSEAHATSSGRVDGDIETPAVFGGRVQSDSETPATSGGRVENDAALDAPSENVH